MHFGRRCPCDFSEGSALAGFQCNSLIYIHICTIYKHMGICSYVCMYLSWWVLKVYICVCVCVLQCHKNVCLVIVFVLTGEPLNNKPQIIHIHSHMHILYIYICKACSSFNKSTIFTVTFITFRLHQDIHMRLLAFIQATCAFKKWRNSKFINLKKKSSKTGFSLMNNF